MWDGLPATAAWRCGPGSAASGPGWWWSHCPAQGSGVLGLCLVRDAMPDSEAQARTPKIMRFPQPHDPGGRPCLSTHRPRSQPPWPTSPIPTRPNLPTPTPRNCSPASLPSPTRELPVAAATPWSPSWAWPPPRYWQAPGRSPRSPSGPPRRPSRSGPGWVPAATPPTTSPSPPRPPSAEPFLAWTPTRWPAPSAPGWPTRTGRPCLLGPAGGGPWPSTARRCAAPTHPTVTAARCICWRRWSMPPARCWPNGRSAAPPRRSPLSPRSWTGSTLPRSWSPPMRSRPTRRPPNSWWPPSVRTTCFRSRPTSRPCWTAASVCPGTASRCWTAPVTAAMAASRSGPSRRSRSAASASPTPLRSCRSPARPATSTTTLGGARP